MEKRQLGKTTLHTAPIVFGGNVFGWTLDQKGSFDILDRFVDAGFNTIDTANSYAHWVPGNKGGESETIIGNWIKARNNRDKVVVITKVGSAMGQGERDISEAAILREADASLRRLQVDQIDLYMTHWDDDKTPVEETLGAYQKLIDAGKIRYIGASNLSPERLTASFAATAKEGLPRYEVIQPEYNLYDRARFEDGVAEICRRENLGVITYYSLASGFLSGKYRSENDLGQSQRGGRVKRYLNERGMRILEALDAAAKKHSVSQAAISLAWLLHQPEVTAPIASATKPEHLTAFTEAAGVNLDEEDLKSLDQ